MAGYCRRVPSRAGTLRPNRQRVPVRRFTPTTRHASALLTPRATNRAYSSRCRVNGDGPRTFPLLPLTSMTPPHRSVLRRSLDSKRSDLAPPRGFVVLLAADREGQKAWGPGWSCSRRYGVITVGTGCRSG